MEAIHMANTSIKDKATTSPALVGEAIKAALPKAVVIPQKIYVGPNLLGLPKYTVIESEFTPHIKTFIADCPAVEKLFVPIAEMANTEQRLQTKGTLEYRHYHNVLDFIANGKGDK